MTDTLIPDKAASIAELDRLELRTQLFIDGRFRDAVDGARFTTRTRRPAARSRRSRAEAPPTWTRPWRRRVERPTMGAGAG